MSDATTDQVLRKVNDAISAVQAAQQTVAGMADKLAEHNADPDAHCGRLQNGGGGTGSCSCTLMSGPVITGPDSIVAGSSAAYSFNAGSYLNGVTITAFEATVTGRPMQTIPASNGTGAMRWSVDSAGNARATINTLTLSVVAVDSAGNRSKTATKSIAVTSQPEQPTYTYNWQTGGWTDNGDGTQSRTVTCQRSDGQTVADSYCDISSKPATTQGTPYTYQWQTGEWQDNGDGTQSRPVTCKRSDGTTVADSYCTLNGAGTKPSGTQGTAYTYQWQTGNWTDNGDGTQSRPVTCKRSDGQTVADSYCSAAGAKPSGTQGTAWTYSWQTGAWQDNGDGTQRRDVTCRRSDGTTVADSFCNISSKPAATQGTPITVKTPVIDESWINGTVYNYAGIRAMTNNFSTITGSDTHKNTDWFISSSSSGSNEIVSAKKSSDLITHIFTASDLSSLVNNNTYYLCARHRGNNGESAIAVSSGFKFVKLNGTGASSSSAITLPSGRKIYRHTNGKGSVLEFDMYGKAIKLFVADAVYRSALRFGLSNAKNYPRGGFSETNALGTTKINGDKNSLSKVKDAEIITDNQLQEIWPGFADCPAAKENCDIWITNKDLIGTTQAPDGSIVIEGVPAVEHARSLTGVISGGLDIPNIYELMVIFLESDYIDMIDITAISNKEKCLGKTHEEGRFFSRYSHSSTNEDRSKAYNMAMHGDGGLNSSAMYYDYYEKFVIPVLEL